MDRFGRVQIYILQILEVYIADKIYVDLNLIDLDLSVVMENKRSKLQYNELFKFMSLYI